MTKSMTLTIKRYMGCTAFSCVLLTGCATNRALPASASRGADRARSEGEAYVRAHYDKHEYDVPMRDGAKLHTIVYAPKDRSTTYPILLYRTPYSIGPYGKDKYRSSLGSGRHFAEEGFIFAYQDVRGRFMSEGQFTNMTPHIDVKQSPADVDESSDTYDTIDWLLANVANHNGMVGQWGISYPGFYTSAGMIDTHPALVAASPQAPIADWWFDDFHHHGAFFLPHAFGFMAVFGKPRPELTTEWGDRFEFPTPDGYQFYLDLGSLKNVNERYFHDDIAMWNEHVKHDNYDDFWQRRNLLPHLKNVHCAVMTVGGWFDAEDLYGAVQTYKSVERQNPGIFNVVVMGPWSHGGWARTTGEHLGNVHFGAETAKFYREHMELPFFKHFLKDDDELDLPEAYMFETGANRWRTFDVWPPAEAKPRSLYFQASGALSFEVPQGTGDSFDEYVSDPAKPIPFTESITTRMTKAYMTDDQRFAGRRPDVLAYQTEVLTEPLTFAGPVMADLWVSTSGTDSDWVVKLIDVFPADAEDHEDTPKTMHMGGYQMMVRSDVIRGRFRNSKVHPEPFVANEPTHVKLELQDVLHTFEPGHRVMVQVQSTWFPLVDRNPQKYVDNIYLADDADFTKATQRVHRSTAYPSRLEFGALPAPAADQ